MLKKKITAVGNSGALVLSKDLLAIMGVGIGDEIEISIENHALVLRSSQEERKEKFKTSLDRVINRRREALQKLAEGPSKVQGGNS